MVQGAESVHGGWSKGLSLCMVGGPRDESVHGGWSKGLSLCMVGGPRG